MSELVPFLKDLLSTAGLSGYEDPAAKIIEKQWRPFVDQISRGKLGSLHALQGGAGKAPRPSVMVATHMDAIGLIVTGVVDGFLHFTGIGGIDARILPGASVTVHGREDLPGVIVQPPPILLPPDIGSHPVPMEHLLVDTGLLPGKVAGLVRVGDLISFAQPPFELTGETLAGHTLDNRASVAALTVCLEELHARPHAWDVWAVATTQEETHLVGATGSAFELRPTIAIVVDVTWAKGSGDSDWRTFPLGKGPTILAGANVHPALYKVMRDVADKLEIPYGLEFAPGNSGTDGMVTQVTAEGIPTIVLGIPLRYMHTPVEVAAIKDIQRCGRLLAGFIAGLQADFMDKIVWEDGKKE